MVLEGKVFIYNFAGFKYIESVLTCPNPRGLCTIDYGEKCEFYACPDREIGKVLLVYLTEEGKQFKINAHESALGVLEVSRDGNFLATASEKVLIC